MKRVTTLSLFLSLFALLSYGQQSNNKEAKNNETSVIQMDNQMFIDKVFDYKNDKDGWKYNGNKPAIIDFYATWCGPCKMVSPIMKSLAEDYNGEIYVYKIDTDQQKELARAMGIQSLPTILFIPMEGQPQAIIGATSKKVFNNAVKEVLLNSN